MKLRDGLLLFGAVLALGLLFVLWTDYAYHRGYESAEYECYAEGYAES